MNIPTIIIIAIFTVIAILGLIVLTIVNKLTFYKKRILDKFNAVNDILNGRIEIITALIEILSKANYHEDNLLKELSLVSEEINKENAVNNLLLLISKSDNILKKALTLDKIYQELSSNKEYQNLVESFKNNQYKLMYAIEVYNEEVEVYNNYRQNKFIDLVRTIFKFKEYNYYEK